jgi:integrase
MAIIRITAEAVAEVMRSARPNRTTYFFDDDLAGFGFYRTPGDTGTFFAEFRPIAGGPKKRIKLGRVGILKANEAREAARRAIANAALGKDLAKDRSDERASVSVKRLADLYIERTRDKKKASTADGYELIVTVNIVPHIGSVKASALTRREVQAMHSKVGASRGKYAANRAVAVLRAAYAWGGKQGHVPEGTNPAAGVERYREEAREHFLSVEEMQRIGEAMIEAETLGFAVKSGDAKHAPRGQRVKMSPHVTAAVRLLMLTGCRLREILNLRWREVDFERGVLRLPDSKTGRKVVFLPQAAIDILKGMTRVGAFVIAGESGGEDDEKPRADLKRPWSAITKRAGVPGIRIHDLRHSYASIGAESGLGLPVIGALLGHSSAQTTKRYAHAADEVSRRAVGTIGGQIAAALEGSK